MSEKEKPICEIQLELVNGGSDTPSWAKNLTPKHDGEPCPECDACRIRFVQFQEYQGKKEEVYDCPNCGYIKFKV